ncbi:MAG: PDZ domain-containing protein [Gammaproteobacteria bacterium]|nr:PDZ domain-containing protein [Gammaproteobacteria bacterium]MYD02242.1 PDZ domain-containing protein [Gammaproteobacteria bacterium]MYI24706.1 PDZ domain-containing protein [Gammaproteobacteria bacterium]
MRFLALTPLLTLMLAPVGLQAHPHESGLPEEQFADMLRQEVLALQERAKGARLGISLGNWADGPVEGLNVLSVSPGGPADQAGLRAEDLLTSINGESLAGPSGEQSYEHLRDMLAETEPGSEISIGYRREGDDLEVQVTTDAWTQIVAGRDLVAPRRFASRAENWARRLANSFSGGNVDVEVDVDDGGGRERRTVRVRRGPAELLSFSDMAWRLGGLQVAELTPALGEYFGVDEGLLVVRAPENEDIGLEDGDVIRKIGGRTFRDARQATRILRSYEPGEEVELEVMRHKRSRTIRFELPERSGRITRGNLLSPPAPAVPEAPPMRGRDSR